MARENLIISIKAEDMASNVIRGVASSIRTLANDLLYTASIQIADGIIDATKVLGSFQMELELTDIAFTQMVKGADRGRASLEEYTDVARALRNELHDLAAETPFSFQDVNRGARQLMAYGFGVKEIEPMLRTIGDAAAAFGGSPIAIYRTIRALGQIKAYGRLKGQELLQLTEVGIPAHEILREELHLSSEQLSRIADQHIPAQEAIDAILKGIEKRYAGMMEVQSRTMQGSIAAIKDNLMLVGTQLTHSLYNEVRDEVRSFRLSLDEYKNMTRVAGWRGLFGQEKYYEKNGKEIDTSKMNQQEYDNLRARLARGEVRRVFDTTHYVDTEGRVVNTATMSPEELSFKELKGDITKKDSLIPSAWQESLFKFGDYILVLVQRAKELSQALGRLWNTLFSGTDGLSDVGYFIFRMINGFISLATLAVEVANSFARFIDKITEASTTGRILETVLVGVASAMMMTAAVNVVQNFLVLINTFKVIIGYAGIVGMQFGVLAGAVFLASQYNSDFAMGILAVGSAMMLYANRAQIAAAATLVWTGLVRTYTGLLNFLNIALIASTIRHYALAAAMALLHAPMALINGALAIYNGVIRIATTVTAAYNAVLATLGAIYGAVRLPIITFIAAVRGGVAVLNAMRIALAMFAGITTACTLASAAFGAAMRVVTAIATSCRLGTIAVTMATVAFTAALATAKVVIGAVNLAVTAFTGIVMVLEGSVSLATLATTLWTTATGIAASITATLSGAVTFLTSIINVSRLSTLAWVAASALLAAALKIASAVVTVFSAVLTILNADIVVVLGAIVLLAAAIYVIYQNWSGIVEWFGKVWQSISEGFSSFVDWFIDSLKKFLPGVYEFFVGAFTSIGEVISGIFGSLWDDIKTFVNNVTSKLKPLVDLLDEIGEKVSNAWDKSRLTDGTELDKFKKFVTDLTDFDPGGGLNLDDITKNYTTPIPQTTGAGKDKKGKEEKLQSWEKEVPMGEYFAHMSTSLDGVGKSVDDLLPKFFVASNSFKHLSGDVDEFVKYAETLSGNGINKSIVYDAKDINHIPQYGETVVYTGEDGKRHVGIYMGDNKVRTAADEVVARWIEKTQSVNANAWSEGVSNGKTMRIDIQGRGECTIKSAEAMIRAHDNVDMQLDFGGANWWWEAMESRFQGADIQSVDDFVNRVTDHFDKFPDSPMSMWVTAGQGGHATNPNEAHAVVIARKTEDGKYVVYDPADGGVKYFSNPADMIDPTFGTVLNGSYGLQGLNTGARVWWRDQSPGITNWANEGLKNYGIGSKQQESTLSLPQQYREWLDNLMPYRLSEEIIDYTIKTAKEFNVDPTQVFAQMWQESKGNQNVISEAGAIGRMQLMPDTAAWLGVNPYDEFENIYGGIKYIAHLRDNYFGSDIDKVISAYNAGPGGNFNNGETAAYRIAVKTKMASAPELGDIEQLGQSVVKISTQVAEVNKEALKNINDLKDAMFIDINPLENMKIVDPEKTKEQRKALDEFYKKQNQINKAVQEYNTYMGASQLKLDEINGNFTEYREKVLEVRSEFAKTVEQAQKLVGQGLSRSDADKMVARAKEVAEAIFKEFERVRKIKFEIDFKTNQSKIAELNHNIEKSLSLQKEAETLQLDADAFEAGKKILKDASAIPEIMAEYAKVRNTGQSFGEFMQDLLSVDEPFTETNSKFADFIKNNEGLWEYWVTLVDAKSQELKQKFELLGKTIYSRTAESYANQGDLQGLLGYLQSPEGEEQRRLEQSFTIQQEWCNRIIDMYRYLGQEVDQAMLTLHDSIIDHGTSAIMDFIKGTKSAKEAFSEFALSVMEDVVKMVLKMAMMEAVSGIFGGLFGGSTTSSGFGTGMMWGNLGLAKGGAVKKGQTALVGEEGPELLSITSGKSALDSPKSMVIGEKGPEVITMPYTGYVIPNDDLLKMVGYYSDDKAMPSYMISGFRAEGGKVEKDKAYIVGEKGPEVFSPGSSGNIFSNEQVNSTLTNLDRISRSGSMGSPYENTPQQTIPPVVVNLDNKSGTQMTAQAESNFDGDQWVVSVVLDAVNRNVGGLRNVIGNVSGRR